MHKPGFEARLEPLDDLFVDEDGWTPLHHAAFAGDAPAVEALLKGGESTAVNLSGNDGYTPFMCALVGGEPKVLALLAQHGGVPPTAAQAARMIAGGAAGQKWSLTPISDFNRHAGWCISPPKEAKGLFTDGTHGCHVFAWERLCPLYAKYVAGGGAPLTNMEAAWLSAAMNSVENMPIKDASENVGGVFDPYKLNDRSLDKILIDADSSSKKPVDDDVEGFRNGP